MDDQNPYAPPADDAPPPEPAGEEGFLVTGRAVEAVRGYQWLVDAFELFKKSPGIWIMIAVVDLGIELLLGSVWYINRLLVFLLAPVFSAGIAIGCQALEDGRPLELGVLFAGFRRNVSRLLMLGAVAAGFNLAATTIMERLGAAHLYLLAMGAGGLFDPSVLRTSAELRAAILGTLGALLAYLAIMIPVWMALHYAPVLVALNNLGAVAALKASFSAAVKNMLPFVTYCVMVFLFTIAAAIPLGLGFLVLLPVLSASRYTSYRDVFYEPLRD